MTPLSRPDLRKLIQRLFRDDTPNAFRDSFLLDYFPTVFRQHGSGTDLTALITALFLHRYQDDGSEILDALVKYSGQGAMEQALAELRGPGTATVPNQPPPVQVPSAGSRKGPGPELLVVRSRGEALGYMREAHALVIGIGSYQHLKKLDNTRNDAQDVASVLTDGNLCGYPPGQVVQLLDAEATKERIISELRALAARTSPSATVFIFAACHGGRIESGEGAGYYLLPVDARGRKRFGERAFIESSISDTELSELLNRIPSRKLFVALDCCYAGGVASLRSEEEDDDAEEGLAAELRHEVLTRLMNSGRGRVILAAANRQQTAKELVTDRNGLFTKYLLQGLQGAGGGPGPFVDVFELYRYVHTSVSRTELSTAQTPVFKAELEGPDLPVAVRAARYFTA